MVRLQSQNTPGFFFSICISLKRWVTEVFSCAGRRVSEQAGISRQFRGPSPVMIHTRSKLTHRNFSHLIDVFKATNKHVQALSEANSDCSICFNKLESGRMWVRLSCGHFFHSKCARLWLCKHSLRKDCPTCRAIVY